MVWPYRLHISKLCAFSASTESMVHQESSPRFSMALACCLIACLLLGSALFAYYCMFAAIAIELIGAVYYTFQLK